MLTSPILVIILQYICAPNHHVVHLPLTQCYMSVTDETGKETQLQMSLEYYKAAYHKMLGSKVSGKGNSKCNCVLTYAYVHSGRSGREFT